MIREFVIDASTAIAWVHPAQATAQSQAVLGMIAEGAIARAPALWPLETANALLVLARRGKLTEDERRNALAALGRLAVILDHEMASFAFGKLSDLATRHGLSIYDAAYLELAQRRKLALACRDGLLRAAARRARVKLL